MKLALICSSGGHIYEMFCLRDFWKDKERYWVSFPTQDVKYLLREEKSVYWAAHPTTRNAKNALKNLYLAQKLLRTNRPDLILSTGAGVAAPFFWLAKPLGIPTVYVESITRINELSLTGKIVKPIASHFFVQWDELARRVPGSVYHGRIE
jgi:UDP-N-acetylglucosamine:LPS N-acetylglucosamine transferase